MLRYWLAMLGAVLVSCCSQMLLKRGAMNKYSSHLREYLNVWVIGGYFLMVVSTVLVIYAYRGIEYKNGSVIESLGIVLVLFFSWLFFRESITLKKLVGVFIIMLGILIFYL